MLLRRDGHEVYSSQSDALKDFDRKGGRIMLAIQFYEYSWESEVFEVTISIAQRRRKQEGQMEMCLLVVMLART